MDHMDQSCRLDRQRSTPGWGVDKVAPVTSQYVQDPLGGPPLLSAPISFVVPMVEV